MKNKNKMIKRVLNSLKETLSITNISDNIHSSYLLCMNLTFEGKCNNAVIFFVSGHSPLSATASRALEKLDDSMAFSSLA